MAWLFSGLLGAVENESTPAIISVTPGNVAVVGQDVSVTSSVGRTLNLATALYDCLVNDVTVTSRLGTFLGSPSIHTRMPVPQAAQYPMIVISPDVGVTNEDGLKSRRPSIIRNIRVFGVQDSDYRVIEDLGYIIREKFHRNKNSISVAGHHVIDVVAAGPTEGVGSDNARIERVVSLTVRLVRT